MFRVIWEGEDLYLCDYVIIVFVDVEDGIYGDYEWFEDWIEGELCVLI